MNEPTRDVYGGGNGASGVTNIGNTVVSGRPRGWSYATGEEEQDSGTSVYRTSATNKDGARTNEKRKTNASLQRRGHDASPLRETTGTT